VDDQSISLYPLPDLDEVEPDIRERIAAVADRTGFVPHVFSVLARRPDEFRAFMAYHDALMNNESGLSAAERELIVVVTSAHNRCLYCVVAHGAILRIRSNRPHIADQVATDWRSADLTERERVLCAASMALASDPATFDDHRESLRSVGLSAEDIWDLGAIVAFFAMSNRIAHTSGLRPNAEFYSMGR
jgi:uncharacterized peroxidase-related enzyme